MLFSRSAATIRANMLRQQAIFGVFPTAGFAKFDRSKPHLNVGTVGKSRFLPTISFSVDKLRDLCG
jgi:hypothetical protein